MNEDSSRRPHARAARLGVALLALSSLMGCSEPPSEPGLLRFVDPALRAGASVEPAMLSIGRTEPTTPESTRSVPTATIQNDTRHVLAAPASAVAIFAPNRETVPDGRPGPIVLPLQDTLPTAKHVFVGADLFVGARWVPIQPLSLPVEGEGTQRMVRPGATAPFFAPLVGQPVRATIYEACPKNTTYRTPAVVVPRDATLEFSVGIMEPARLVGTVRARVDACDGDACRTIYDEVLNPADPKHASWQDRTVDVRELAGRRRTFVFSTAPEAPATDGFSLPVWANPTLRSHGFPAARGPNVILVSIDTLRRDHLSLYGYGRAGPTSS